MYSVKYIFNRKYFQLIAFKHAFSEPDFNVPMGVYKAQKAANKKLTFQRKVNSCCFFIYLNPALVLYIHLGYLVVSHRFFCRCLYFLYHLLRAFVESSQLLEAQHLKSFQ